MDDKHLEEVPASDLEESAFVFKGITSELKLAVMGFLGGKYFKPRWWSGSDPESLPCWCDCKYFHCRGDIVSIGQMTKMGKSGMLVSVEQLGLGCEGLICGFCQVVWHTYSNVANFELPM